MRIREFLIFLFLCLPFTLVMATHQRAGEITYRHVSGLTYEFTLTTYVYTHSLAKRPEIDILWGDGSSSTIRLLKEENQENDVTLNVYVAEHTFPNTGTYTISFEDANRNSGVVNIPNSVNIPLYVETILVINPFLGTSNSPRLLNPPIDNGCVNTPFYHNPGAYDPDGDSLSFRLVYCRGYDGEDIPGYTFPSASSAFSIDSRTGIVTWNTPQLNGEYNIAILIEKWRAGYLIGSVVRDMQITISPCNNYPPEIITITDTCVLAGQTLFFDVTATDETSTRVTLSATGAPFEVTSPASFPEVSGTPPVTSRFRWNTSCQHIKAAPYTVLFKASDNGPQVSLSNYHIVNISVVAPPPENLAAIAAGNTVHLTWEASSCANATGYAIYKRQASNPFVPDNCETGMPPEEGYSLIGANTGHGNTLFIDDGSVAPLYHGNEYCYRVVALFRDGSESYVSEEVCTSLLNDAPLMIKVDIDSTDVSAGAINLAWTSPPELDQARFPGPYEYHVYRSSANTDRQLVAVSYSLHDTTLVDLGLDTQNEPYYYTVELYSETLNGSMEKVEVSDQASSIFLSAKSSDREVTLSWQEQVPWSNTEYTIYREDYPFGKFDSIATTSYSKYTDAGLTNEKEYRYYIRSKGRYSTLNIIDLYNRSQQVLAVPIDNVPPEVPVIRVTTDCKTVELSWTFSSDTSYLDVFNYYIYYKPNHTAEFVIIDSIPRGTDACFPESCFYQLSDIGIIAGCFGMSAIDKNGNMSAIGNITCFDYDDCMSYELPNIFTPNGDEYNATFTPFPYANVSEIEMYIYDKWGRLVFTTRDPDIHWNGINNYSGKECPEGTYYYTCDVFASTLSGVIKKNLKGTVTIVRR